ncbi:MAG: AIR synthase-related protein, partial [Candidatus Bathyarchaeia archaeon]
AMTGIVGVNRDPLGTGKGAAPMLNMFVFGLGNPFSKVRVPEKMLHPRRIRDGVHKGVIDGGNQSGIPLARGREVYDPRFGEVGGKPLVYCGTVAIMPRQILGEGSEVKHVEPGNYIIMVGGRIGKDGIHGATFASEELHERSPVQAVQIGDPITQKKMVDLLLEARDLGLYRGITDNGAGGLSSSIGEMARLPGGCEVWLERAPLKYQGLDPWEILLSEAQERMTLAVEPEKVDAFLALAAEMEVEATVMGRFTDSGKFHAMYAGRTVAYVDMEFLHNGLPRKSLQATWRRVVNLEPSLREQDDYNQVLKDMLGRLNVCSIEKKLRQYDHEVKGLSVIKPLVGKERDVPSDATISLLEYGSYEGLALAEGICPHYSDIDTYHMAQSAMDEAVRRIIAVGGKLPSREDVLCVLDNFSWCDPEPSESNPDATYKMAQLVRACKGLYDYAIYFGVPFISGKDSMKNDSIIEGKRVSIPPTILITSLAKIRDVRKAVTLELKRPGDLVYVVGETYDEMGGSEYLRYLGEKARGHPYVGNSVPKVNLERALATYKALSRAIDEGLVQSAHTPTVGGLGVALALTAFAGMLGLDIDLGKAPMKGVDKNCVLLFSESNSRFIVTVSPSDRERFEECLAGVPYALVGKVTEEQRIRVRGLGGILLIDCELTDLKKAWKKTFEDI